MAPSIHPSFSSWKWLERVFCVVFSPLNSPSCFLSSHCTLVVFHIREKVHSTFSLNGREWTFLSLLSKIEREVEVTYDADDDDGRKDAGVSPWCVVYTTRMREPLPFSIRLAFFSPSARMLSSFVLSVVSVWNVRSPALLSYIFFKTWGRMRMYCGRKKKDFDVKFSSFLDWRVDREIHSLTDSPRLVLPVRISSSGEKLCWMFE